MHAYDLVRAIPKATGEALDFGEGSVDPMLGDPEALAAEAVTNQGGNHGEAAVADVLTALDPMLAGRVETGSSF